LTSLPDDLVHYSEPRIPTVREYARIQSFPDWFEFKAKYTTGDKHRREQVPRYTQVANAVPPLLAEAMGLALQEFLVKVSLLLAPGISYSDTEGSSTIGVSFIDNSRSEYGEETISADSKALKVQTPSLLATS
jgi:hypothetical protein